MKILTLRRILDLMTLKKKVPALKPVQKTMNQNQEMKTAQV